MNITEILKHVDHTKLDVDTTFEDIKQLCDDAVQYQVASVCIPPAFVKKAARYLGGKIPVCTVIGFPNGYSTTEVKAFEAKKAIEDGADEIDMVIHIGSLKSGQYDDILEDIVQVKKACGNHILKVIVETCLLTEEEKIKMCELVNKSGADYIKTSTGFSKSGATPEDIALFSTYILSPVKIKAAGGIKSLGDAENMMKLGADRLGTSRIINLVKGKENQDGAY